MNDISSKSKDLRDPDKRKEFLTSLPHQPGVYIMKGEDEKVIYVGKAIDLNNRLKSYFSTSGDDRFFVEKLPAELVIIEIILVNNEREALLLESSLIKEFQPKYNVFLKDDKSYYSIKIDHSLDYPRLELVRGLKKTKPHISYYGPYHSSRSIKAVLSFLLKYFKFRTCGEHKFKTRKRPCLRYHMSRCLAPCMSKVSQTEYKKQMEQAQMYLQGKQKKLLRELQQRMNKAARNLNFEKAAYYRDILFALEEIDQPQNVVNRDFTPLDIVGYAREDANVALIILEMRRGEIKKHRQLILNEQSFPDQEIISSFLTQHYLNREKDMNLPDRIILPFEFLYRNALEELLAEKFSKKIELEIPQDDSLKRLSSLAAATARGNLKLDGEFTMESQLQKLAIHLKMKKFPKHIECYDISHLQGKWSVGSMAVFIDGKPESAKYRRFNIKTAKPGDDFGALKEVLSRRTAKGEEAGWEFPDLVVIDGGKGQLNSVFSVVKPYIFPINSKGFHLISLAKERAPDGPPDRFFLPGVKNPVSLKSGGRELYILSRIRDEAHRFAIEGHRKKRINQKIRSELGKIPEIGEVLQKRLIVHFGSVKRIKKASTEEIALVDGIGPKTAQLVYKYFHPDESGNKGQ
ncbi:MAG: excinuclease ABC subunit UvrC [Deltaproteobacteria bacterium]|nr:excinuclease ABC subunit UvrC [Deltaproteobacteria bacterium]